MIYECARCHFTGERKDWGIRVSNPYILICPKCETSLNTESATNTLGIKHDKDKPRWDLLPYDSVGQVVDVLTFGAAKYADDNWKKVPDARRRYIAAAMRHLTAWIAGERKDPESGLHHLAHAACCILFLLWLDDTKEKEVMVPIKEAIKNA